MGAAAEAADLRPDRGVQAFLRAQTPVSLVAGAAGAAALLVLVAGGLAVVTAHGWTPAQSVAAAIVSGAFGAVLVSAAAVGIAAALAAWRALPRMPTKPAREACLGGAALGLQAAVLAGFLLWFRGGDVEVFARNFLEFSIVGDFVGRFVRGAVNTVILALSGEALGIVLGLVLAVFALSHRMVVRAPARAYINFFRGTPLFWQIQFGFFGIVLGLRMNLTPYQVAILIIGLNAAAYSAEVFRAGIQSIERGQFDAARGLGMSYGQALRHVVLPQGIRRVIPPLTNEFVILIKDTSLVSILGLTLAEKELLGVGRDIYSATFNATPFLASAAGYLAITLPMIRFVTWLERRLRSGLTGIWT